jgi:hypothetical protein
LTQRVLTGTEGELGAALSGTAERNVTSTMIRAWWSTNMDSRRSISLLIDVAGSAVAAIGMAASPEPWAFGGNYAVIVGPILAAAAGGYIRHRRSGDERAPLWALAYGVSVAALLVAMFGTAAVIRPTVLGLSGLSDAWYGLFMGGFMVMFVGTLLWERDARRRRLAAVLLLVLWLMVGGVFARAGGDRWAPLGPLVLVGGVGVLILAFALSRPSSNQDAAKPIAGWR